MTAPAGPRRVDVAAAYDLGVDAYVSLWSPVILPPAQAVVAGLGLEGTPRVLDIGAGPGSLVSSILDVAPTAQVVALDASIEMLRAAADQASAVWEEAFADAGIGPLPPRRVDTGLDSPDTIDALLRGGGLAPQRIWLEMLTHRWEPATFWRLVTGTGANRARLQLADPDTRARFLATVRARLDALDLVPCQETFALSHAGQNRRWLRPRPRRTKRAPSSCVLASDDSDSAWTNERSLTRH